MFASIVKDIIIETQTVKDIGINASVRDQLRVSPCMVNYIHLESHL